jgi:hypothetical protein
MVHFDKAYGTFADAVKQRDGLAVIGLLFKATDKIPADPKFKLLLVRFHYSSVSQIYIIILSDSFISKIEYIRTLLDYFFEKLLIQSVLKH